MYWIHQLVAFYILFTLKFHESKRVGNVVNAIAHMEPLVEIERRLVKLARTYLDQERHKLAGLQQFARQVDEAVHLSKDEPIKYLGNPVNSYLIIKRFTSGWADLAERLTVDDKNVEDIQNLLVANDMYLPTHEGDMVGASEAIFRLQDTYNIPARNISDGRINGIRRSAHQFSAEDCLDIAIVGHTARRYVRMLEWLHEGERIMFDPMLRHRRGDIKETDLYEYLAWSYYLANDMKNALKYTNKVLAVDPLNKNALENERIYSWYKSHKEAADNEPEMTYMQEAQHVLDNFTASLYCQACRQKTVTPKMVKNMSNLVCFYHKNTPRFILKPGKVTRIHDNPEVYVFHDLLLEWEVKKLKEIATPRLRPSEVIDENNDHVTASYRVSKNLFFDPAFDEDRNISDHLQGRLEEITGLDMKYAETLQINNYGLGGQYEFHIDHGLPGTSLDTHPNGNRIATLLFYLSDVESGGSTVFTQIGLKLEPRKGDGVFWYNLYRNGTGIAETQHASCPVLSGSKWVVNKWIHLHGNEFKRRCALDRNI